MRLKLLRINVLAVLLVISFLAKCSIHKTERPPLSRFLNYGIKKYKSNYGLRNEIVKSKVTVLGDILKKHVQKLRMVPHQSLELVFLVDSSASVGAENFFSELKFVKKLLADFVVSYNHTRVAVITFSSRAKVIRHIDHVAHASERNHKCSLLERELPKIRYSGGGTYTLGALLEAQGVLAISRENAVKVVFLVTDGYSNGGNPRPAAQFLKDKGVIIFTFGIKNGNIKELYDMASDPKEEHSYILDSFKEFEALARRALHEDLQNDVMLDQKERECNSLCKRGFACCDKHAYCTCGAHTGLYACNCRKGFYGTGLENDCRPCPESTYRDFEGPGDVTTCQKCPNKHMTSNQGSTSLFHCFCRKGYTQSGFECDRNKCQAMNPPENGYFVKGHCENVLNAACGIRCNSGYDLIGSSIRLCKVNGSWSGIEPRCVMKLCPELAAPRHGLISCSSDKPDLDSVCHFSCKPGYRLIGSRSRTCLPISMWDGIKAYCKQRKCPPHSGIKNGIVTPSVCTSKKMKFGTVCNLHCNPGYTLKALKQTLCNSSGAWSGGDKQRCIDIDAPIIKCPQDVYAKTEKSENYAEVTWNPPVTKDSSGGRVFLWTRPVVSNPMKFKIGSHLITYHAKDGWGNKANCSFMVRIEDKEPPRVDWCESPPTFLSKDEEVNVYWEEPLFSDNSGQFFIDRSQEPGKFKQGKTIVEYWALDNSGNKATCNITINVQLHACELPVDPVNGASNCTENPDAVFCTLTCQDGYAFALRPQQDYFCSYDGIWMPDGNPMPFPECSSSAVSNTVTHTGEMDINDDEGNSVCNDMFLISQLENDIEKKLEDAIDEMCSEDIYCSVAVVEAVCESILAEIEEENNVIHSRKKRSPNEIQIESIWTDLSPDYRYWLRGSPTGQFFVPERLDTKKRVKRQFGFPSGFFEKEENSTITAERDDMKANFLGVLTGLILESLGNDIGLTRFSTFLSKLDPTEESYSMDDFLAAFSKEFGEEKARSLKEIAKQKMGKLITKDKSPPKKVPEVLSSTEKWAEIYTPDGIHMLDVMLMEKSDIQADEGKSTDMITKQIENHESKSLKVKFKIQGQGSEPNAKVKKAMNGILSFAENGKFDVDFGEKQLKIAAIRLSEDPEYNCDPGRILQDKMCVSCPVGTFFNIITKTCQPCPSGSFQPKEGQVSCLVCPKNTSTKINQAKSYQDCKALCLPGSFSSDSLEPCTTCHLGNYQDTYASLECLPCPNGTTTWRRGSWVMDECKVPCNEGYVSETGLEPCLPCPMNSFQPAKSQSKCYSCPNGTLSESFGTESVLKCIGVENDTEVVLSQLKTIEINSCFSFPCENEGICNALEFGYVCSCVPGYTGQQCEAEIDECLVEPCHNNGTCVDQLADFECNCKAGFEGAVCEVNINECQDSPCNNNGSCIDLVNKFDCICDSGYAGDTCEINIDDCEDSPCENGATCVDGISDFSCVCQAGFNGRFCENDIDNCEDSPCIHGSCVDGLNMFSCNCDTGYEGKFCDININDCDPDTCLNGAICNDLINSFRCDCKPGYNGKRCHKELSSNFVMEMTNPGVMDYAKIDNFPHELNEVSVCFWMKTADSNNYGTPFSYATEKSDNSLTLTDYSGFVFYVNGDKEITDIIANDGYWHMICCTWRSRNGTWAIFKDTFKVDYGQGLASGQNISNKGAFVIGQEQDQIGGKYSPPESFIGEMALFNIWDHVLTDEEIQNLFTTCERYVGSVRAWPDFQTGVMGHIKIKPSQFCRGCGVPRKPENAKLNYNGTDAGINLTVTCNPGYKMYKGDFQRTCRIDGQWSGEVPECRAIYCDFPKPLYHGEVKASTYKFGDVLMSSCDAGYRLIGSAKRNCLANGKWQGQDPYCELVVCPKPKIIDNAIVISGLSSYLPTNKVIYSCMNGYQMDGPASKTCTRGGNWEGSSSECQPIYCGQIPKIKNSKINKTTEILAGESVFVECSTGFVLEKPVRLECLADGNWKRPFPKCVLPYCDKPPKITNGKVIVRASTTEREAFYKCEKGYVVSGVKTLQCTTNGTWNHQFSKCVPQPCPIPPNIVNGAFQNKSNWIVGDKVNYYCIEGFILTDDSSLECILRYLEGEWIGKVPSCSEIFCPRVNNIDHGLYTIYPPPNKYKFIVFPKEASISRHKRNILLNDADKDFPAIRLGISDDHTQNTKPADYSDYNFVSQSQGFDDPDGISQTAGFGDYGIISQSQGLDDPGEMSQTAGISDYDFISQSQGFDDPGQISPSGLVDYDFVAQPLGFDNYGEISQTAGLGEYDYISQSQGLDDPDQSSPKSGLGDSNFVIPSQGFAGPGQVSQIAGLGDYDFISQSQGFDSSGEISQTDGMGDYDIISQSQGFDDSGQISQTAGFGNYDFVSQSQGFDNDWQISQPSEFINNNAISQSQGSDNSDQISVPREYSNDNLYLQNIDESEQIPHPSGLINSNSSSQSENFDNTDQISQAPVFNYDEQITQSAEFDDPSNSSKNIDDAHKVSQSAGIIDYDEIFQNVDETDEISQSVGFYNYDDISQIVDDDTKEKYPTVDDIEQISQLSGLDENTDIDQISDFDNNPAGYLAEKYPYNTTIKYKCAPGYKLIGSASRRCSELGDWNQIQPRCYEMYCIELLPLENGYLLYHGSGINSKIEYVCNDGFQIVGDRQIICAANQQWIGTIPFCKHIDCGIPHEPENGTVEYTSTFFGSVATYDCSEGFVFEGINERFCDYSGYWNGSLPRCTAITCDVPPVIKNGYITFEGSLYAGSPVEYMCKECYQLIGTIERECQLDGTWSLEAPVCEIIQCKPILELLDHGKIIGNNSFCGSLIEYECDPGYYLKGSKQIRCLENMMWSNTLPNCKPVSCGQPPSVRNSEVSGSSHNFLNKIEYICNQGYKIYGNNVLICNEYGRWTGNLPKCNIVSCEKPKGPSNGKVKLSGLFYKSYAKIVCDPGFQLDGNDHLVCLEDGKWDKEMPYCVPTLCPAAIKPPNSFYNSSEVYFESFSKLFYNCSIGYTTSQQNTLMTCNSEGNWTGSLIECNPIKCGRPISPTNGYLVFNKLDDEPFVYKKTASFNCKKGYELIGDSNITCLSTGVWSGYASCEQIICKHFEKPDNSVENHILDRYYGTSITYTCKEGYILHGSATITCEESGLWSDDIPKCLPVTCPEPIEVFGATVTGETFEYNNSIIFKCLDGYSMTGIPSLICSSNGKWSDEFPTCDIITCTTPTSIPNGKWEKSSFNDFPIKTEPSGHSLKHSKLAKFTQILEEQTEVLLFKLGQSVKYNCNEGYYMLSIDTSECTENGWKPPPPVCKIITCSKPTDIPNGIVVWHNITFASKIFYKCDEGYEIVGNSERYCKLNGLWSSISPFCIPIRCPDPDNLFHGTVSGDSYHFRSVLSFKCDSGFDLSGPSTRICQSNAFWSGVTPTCNEIFCGHPGNTAHASLELSGFTVGHVASYSCKKGYNLEGKSFLTCLSSGDWEFNKPRCILIECNLPTEPKNGVANGNLTSYNSKVHYSCKLGYKLIGANTINCLESGQWSNEIPSCSRIQCSSPAIPSHANVINNDDDKLDSLVDIRGSKSKRKKNKKQMKRNKKRKNKLRKSKLIKQDKLYYAFDTITYQCEKGWYAEVEMELTCTTAGLWVGDDATCHKINCGTPPLPDDALYDGYDFSYGGIIEYYCSIGYTIKGNNRLSCVDDGDWEGDVPICQPVDCGNPFIVPNSDMEIKAYKHGHKNKYGSIAVYSCKPGYELEGPSAVMCDMNGRWKTTGRLPDCKEKQCQTLPRIRHARSHQSQEDDRQRIAFQCDPGYLSEGEPSISCYLGQWEITNFTCNPVNCQKPPLPENSVMSANEFTYGSQVRYSCQDGYRVIGNPSIECGPDSLWLGEIPDCAVIDCGDPEKLENGGTIYTETIYLSTALYTCNNGYKFKGNNSRKCSSNGKWSGHVPQCHIISCPEPEIPKDGFIIGSQYYFGNTVHFTCKKGHVLKGNNTIICNDEGKWSSDNPICEAVMCHPPKPIVNVDISQSNNKPQPYETKIELACQDGFIPRGDMSSECLENTTWSVVKGKCSRMACGRPIIKKNDAMVIGRSYYYKDHVRYLCPPGSKLNGSSTATCLSTGWSSTPSCVPGCRRNCKNGGVCVAKNTCSCPSGFTGENCENALCVLPCLNGGVCVGQNKCTCLPGYAGARCQNPVCEEGCGRHGRCIGPNVCLCRFGQTGPTCNKIHRKHKQETHFGDWNIASIRRRF